jgi:hypothetical protein
MLVHPLDDWEKNWPSWQLGATWQTPVTGLRAKPLMQLVHELADPEHEAQLSAHLVHCPPTGPKPVGQEATHWLEKMNPVLHWQTPLTGEAPVGQAAMQVDPTRLKPVTQLVQMEGAEPQVLQGYEQSLQTPLTGTAWGLAQVVQNCWLEQVLHLLLQGMQVFEVRSANWLGLQALTHCEPILKNPAAQLMQLAQSSTQPLHSGLQASHLPLLAKKLRGQVLTQVPLRANPETQLVQFLATFSQVAQVESHLSHWLMGVLKSPRAQLKVQMPPIMM